MKVFVNLCLIAICATSLIIAGCSATASLNKIQTSNNYTNKLPLKAAVYIPSELSNREVITSPSTATCSVWKAKVNSGNGYYTAIESGLSAAIQVVNVVNTAPSPELAKTGGYDLLVTVNLANENSSVAVNPSVFSSTINSQFQVSFSLIFSDRNGQSLYSLHCQRIWF